MEGLSDQPCIFGFRPEDGPWLVVVLTEGGALRHAAGGADAGFLSFREDSALGLAIAEPLVRGKGSTQRAEVPDGRKMSGDRMGEA